MPVDYRARHFIAPIFKILKQINVYTLKIALVNGPIGFLLHF